jgi:hypothetical protein
MDFLQLFYILSHIKSKKIETKYTSCSLGLSATSQQYFSLRTNQPAVLFSQRRSAPAISHQPTEQADSSI